MLSACVGQRPEGHYRYEHQFGMFAQLPLDYNLCVRAQMWISGIPQTHSVVFEVIRESLVVNRK